MIDLNTPSALLATNYSSLHEPTDHNCDILSFEVKPKSGVTEYVPQKVLAYLEANRTDLGKFWAKGELATDFQASKLSKF